ncbi:MAG: hypothetical protein PHI12_13320 [Dehalococcoidales bacterium]|nr:hypothetical protein [Dehalococcoidales bacterium]
MRDELNKAMAETEAAYQRLRELIDKQRTVFNQYCCLKYEVEIGGEVYSKNGGIAILDAFLMRDNDPDKRPAVRVFQKFPFGTAKTTSVLQPWQWVTKAEMTNG